MKLSLVNILEMVFVFIEILFKMLLFKGGVLIYAEHCIYMSAVKDKALTQINFNGTNFINPRLTQRVFSVWPMAQPVFGEMDMHSVANLATLQTPSAIIFFFFKKAPKPYLVSENHRY